MKTLTLSIVRFGYWATLGGLMTCLLGVDISNGAEKNNKPGKEDVGRELEAWLKVLEKVEHADFMISGQVLDEAGRPLAGVKMNVTRSRSEPSGEYEYEEYTKAVEGAFQLKLKKASKVSLEFEKSGYYCAETNFCIPPSMDQWDEVEDAEREGRKPNLEDLVVKVDNVVVVLEKKGNLTRLVEFKGGVRYYPDGSGTVINFDHPPKEDVAKRYNQKVTNLLDRSTLPSNCMYAIPSFGTDNKPLLADYRYGAEYEAKRVYCLPQTLKICLSRSDGGFVTAGVGHDIQMLRKLKQAPVDGYVQPFILSADKLGDLLRRTEKSQFHFFYCRINGQYGKGYIIPSSIQKDEIIGVGIRLYLQPDGSRNLETGN